MLDRYFRFVRAVSINRIGLLGVALTTASFITFLLLELARLLGVVTQAYVGLISYMAFPAIFILGLLLIPIGWKRAQQQTGLSGQDLLDAKFGEDDTRKGFFGSRVVLSIGAMTLMNLLILVVATSRMLHFMEEPNFCGTACHTVMNPEWVTYQESPHARVACVDCHVGEGVEALIDSKLSGLRQIMAVVSNSYERPIPTPVHNLRPARETCERCHWPDKFYGQRLKTIAHFAEDEKSTPEYTTLALKIDSGRRGEVSGIHWHVAEDNEVRYLAANETRTKMAWVEVRQADGSYKRYTNRRIAASGDSAEASGPATAGHEADAVRTLDCIDCHNRATHIYEEADDAVDHRIERGLLDRSLPFLRREAVAAISGSYSSREQAEAGIKSHIENFYRRNHPDVARTESPKIDQAVAVLQDTYQRNIHPQMRIEWGTYRSHLGHKGGGGCFRCHDPALQAEDGSTISADCTLCHSILAQDSPAAFAYLGEADSTSRDFRMHEYLKAEFLSYSRK
ncbi:MAG: NapC/NirT family cytochrome c [Candidatus Eisenbacteria bacterium]